MTTTAGLHSARRIPGSSGGPCTGSRALALTVLFALASSIAWAADAAREAIEVTVVEKPATDSWQVTYRFDRPVAGVVFQRRREPLRSARWRLLTDGVEWATQDDRETLIAAEPVTEIRLGFASDFEPRVKGYELNVSFTDGGRLLYAGDLTVRPLWRSAPGDGLAAGEPVDHRWRFAAREERWIVFWDLVGRGGLSWTEPAASTGDSGYVYFGPQQPEVRERLVYLVDPGLPAWLRDRADWILPRLIDRFVDETGVELAFRPLVLISHRPADISGLTFSGGTLDGLVQMAAIGRSWENRTAEADAMWLDRTAHEIFHFWAGETFVAVLEGGDAWLTEGGADLFALRALLGLGLIDDAEYRRRLVANANGCLVGLGGRPVLSAAEPGLFRNLYTCGSTLWLWAGAAVGRATGSDDGLGDFVRALFAAADGGELTTYSFLETLHRLTGDPGAGTPLARLLFQGLPAEADRFFLERMRESGLPVRLAPAPEATLPPGTDLPTEAPRSWIRLLRLETQAPSPPDRSGEDTGPSPET